MKGGRRMKIAKALWYGMFVNHHLNKITRLSKAHTTAIKYHHEMSLHYFKKAYDKEFERNSNN